MENENTSLEEQGLSGLKDLADKLTRKDIEMLHIVLSVPNDVSNINCNGIEFLFALKEWTGLDSFRFFEFLSFIRPDLIRLALGINWFSVPLDQRYEMKQLSHISVDASLATLLQEDDPTCTHSPTHSYSELILYLIRRQLCRMRLQESSMVTKISDLDGGVLDCLNRIGFLAYQSVARRELMLNKTISLRVGSIQTSACLDLIEQHLRLEKVGVLRNVSPLSHLSIQEFTAAIWLSGTSWWEQCMCVRFLANTEDVFSLFRKVVRFTCGLSVHQSKSVFTILCKELLSIPLPICDLPKCVQLCFESDDFFNNTGWVVFTERFIQLSTLLFEFNSDYIPDLFHEVRRYLPSHISFYILCPVPTNEWICFLRSLPLLIHIHLIYLDARFVTPANLLDLLHHIEDCSLRHLAIRMGWKDSAGVLAYTNVFQSIEIPRDTKVCFELSACELLDPATAQGLLSCSMDRILSDLSLFKNGFSPPSLGLLVNQLFACDSLRYWPNDHLELGVLLPALCYAAIITGMHLYYIPTEYHEQLFSLIPQLPHIRDLTWSTEEGAYSLLPHITHLTDLSYLQVRTYLQLDDTNLRDCLLLILDSNRQSIKGLVLYCVMEVGVFSLERLSRSLRYCYNLQLLELHYTHIACDDVTLWCSTIHSLISLAYLDLLDLNLFDSGMLQLCNGLLFHLAIRGLAVDYCRLTSNSCESLMNLIPTLSQLNKLRVTELSTPDPGPIKLLTRTADRYSIQHALH